MYITSMLIAPSNKSWNKTLKKKKISKKESESIIKNIICFNCKKIKQSKNQCFYCCNDCNEIFCEICILNCFVA